MGGVAPLQLPRLADHLAGRLRHHQHGGHAEAVRHLEVAGEVLEHRRAFGLDVMAGEELLVGRRRRLRLELRFDDAEHVLEMRIDGEPLQHRVRVLAGPVGEDQLAARQLRDGVAQRDVRLQRRMVDRMHVAEIVVGIHAMLGHQPAHGGAVALVKILLQQEGFLRRQLEEVRHIVANAHVDLLPQVDVMRVERVVEVEHPCIDMGEAALGGLDHRRTVRSVFDVFMAFSTARSCLPRRRCRSGRSRRKRSRATRNFPAH